VRILVDHLVEGFKKLGCKEEKHRIENATQLSNLLHTRLGDTLNIYGTMLNPLIFNLDACLHLSDFILLNADY
jgi:hypothetical protein